MVARVSCRNSEILRVGNQDFIHVMKQHTRRYCSTRTVGKDLACPAKSQDKGKHMKMFNIFPTNNPGQHREKAEMPRKQLPAVVGGCVAPSVSSSGARKDAHQVAGTTPW